jgi:hypothetical protein
MSVAAQLLLLITITCSMCAVHSHSIERRQGRLILPNSVRRITNTPPPLSSRNFAADAVEEVLTISAVQVRPSNADCDAPTVFQRRLAVFYGIPPNRVSIVAASVCHLNFTFVNNSFDGSDYYSNRQLTALLLSLNTTYVEQFLLISSLTVSNATSSPSVAPVISPIPRPPADAQTSQTPKKLFLASFASTSGVALFQQKLATFLAVDHSRIAWSLNSNTILYFSVNDNNDEDISYANIGGDDISSYPLPPRQPLRNDVEAAVISGGVLSPEFSTSTTLQWLGYSVEGEGNTVHTVQKPTIPLTPVVFVAGADNLSTPFTFAARILQTFSPIGGVSNTTFFPLSSGSSSGTSSGGVMFVGVGDEASGWSGIASCLATHVSAPIVPAPGDGNRPLYTIIGIVFVFTGLAAVIVAVMRRKSHFTLGLEGEYLNTSQQHEQMGGGSGSAASIGGGAASSIEMSPQELLPSAAAGPSVKSSSASDRTNLLSSAM